MSYEKCFLEPSNPTHRQYEALRAFFVEQMPQKEVAERFGYTVGSFRVLCHHFRKNSDRQFFLSPKRGPQQTVLIDPVRDRIVELRKQNLSIYDIADQLRADGRTLSPPAIASILQQEGFARLPRRRDDERPPGCHPAIAPVADVRELDLSERQLHTKFGGLFLFLPFLARLPLDSILDRADFPGSTKIPAGHAMRSLLGLKLFGNARHTHVMSDVFDQGLGLFAGLNVTPKSGFLTQYSCRVNPQSYPIVMTAWLEELETLGWRHGDSFDADFHTIPSHGEDALMEKHYVSKRSRSQRGLVAFVVNDTENRAFCYVDTDIRKCTMSDQVLAFVEFWSNKTGSLPKELVFDSKMTTYANLSKLDQAGVAFITLRARTPKLLEQVLGASTSAWRKVELENVARAYRTPQVLDQRITLRDYEGELRQIAVRGLGHDLPTILITNQMKRSTASLVQRYARRMIIENNIADAIDFFHMDALSSVVALKVNCDLVLTLMGSALYRLFAARIGNGYRTAEFRRIFRDFICATAQVEIAPKDITVRFQKRSHNPMLAAAGFGTEETPIPWLGGKRLRFQLG